ncbi:hypothetical protein E2C01_055217 [Portunus trituberculatus]|uniref:Uncharacterized protein n=1 Tax=Portunus trituberculatus TaxID=210409 RepID=A0A5B7GU43_PORTR|nr:hypothetical protein [Portunus trituberculatus]
MTRTRMQSFQHCRLLRPFGELVQWVRCGRAVFYGGQSARSYVVAEAEERSLLTQGSSDAPRPPRLQESEAQRGTARHSEEG